MSKFSNEELLRLYSIPGIGPARMRMLISAVGSPREVLDAPVQRLCAIRGIDKSTARRIKQNVDENFVQQQLYGLENTDIRLTTYWDDGYPVRLKKIYDPPVLLWMRGEIKPQDDQALGIVGTRVPSAYGRLVTEQFSRELVKNGFAIVSGLARGVDTIAHRTAVENGGRTIAVMGSGVDNIYPRENKKLVERIVERGAIISEYPLGARPDAGNFPRRNRIISGLSLGILITEAGAKSGALITAFQALEQNREIFAVPGPILSGKSAGSNRLIKDGAKLVQGTLDIMQELEGVLQTGAIPQQPAPQLAGMEKTIYDLLRDEPVHVDELSHKCGKSTPEVLSTLLTLELMGVVKQLSGKMFARL